MNVTKGSRKGELPPSRKDKLPITFWLPKPTAIRLKTLAVQLDTSVNALMEEATEMLFTKHSETPQA